MKRLAIVFIAACLLAGCGNDDDGGYWVTPISEKELDKRPGTAYIVSIDGASDFVVVCYKDVAVIKSSTDSQDVYPIANTKLCEA